ncbi:MAG: helix-turn-helix transcriptional regulator [Pseudomonadota bacterium]
MKLDPEVLTTIYDAAVSDVFWSSALDACAKIMTADAATLYEFSPSSAIEYHLEKSSSYITDRVKLVSEYNDLQATGRGSGYDQEGLPAIHKTPKWSVLTDNEIWSINEEYRSRPEVAIPAAYGLFRRSFVNLRNDPSVMRGIVFLYGREFDDQLPLDSLPFGSLIGPHLGKASEIFRLTHGLRQKYQAVLSVLDHVDTGVLVVLGSAQIVVANRAATQTLDSANGLKRSKSGALISTDDKAEGALKHSILETSSTARGENDRPSQVVQIPRRAGSAPLVAIVSPLRDAAMEIEQGLTGALITLIDPERPVAANAEAIGMAYGLSKAEERVAGFLLQGLKYAEISERVGVRPETIKSQVSSILLKSGCSSRAAFVWRAFQLIPPIK